MLTIVLDSGPLGMVSNPKSSPENSACKLWFSNHVAGGSRVIVPEIADYEVRRELHRATKTAGIARLDVVEASLDYLAITTPVMRHASELWAQIRKSVNRLLEIKRLTATLS